MTPTVAMLLGIAVGAGLVLAAQLMGTLNARLRSLKDIQDSIDDILGRESQEPALLTEREREEWKAADEPQEPAAIPLNPNNPPIPRVFNPGPERDPREYPLCNCHDRRLTAGEQIIWWPQPDGSVMIFHPDFIAQAAAAT